MAHTGSVNTPPTLLCCGVPEPRIEWASSARDRLLFVSSFVLIPEAFMGHLSVPGVDQAAHRMKHCCLQGGGPGPVQTEQVHSLREDGRVHGAGLLTRRRGQRGGAFMGGAVRGRGFPEGVV